MHKIISKTVITLLTLLLTANLALAANGRLGQAPGSMGGGDALALLPYEELSETEIEALTYMVEEEKVARDVYNALYELWELPIFANIAASEQRHMDAVAALLDKYGLVNPAVLEAGFFADGDLQTLYDNLVAEGSKSIEDALLVGATIEDLDIYDLKVELTLVDNQDILQVFSQLEAGSENHLRAFTTLLVVYGYAPYQAQFLSQEEIDAILAASPEKVTGKNDRELKRLDADGDGVCDFLHQ